MLRNPLAEPYTLGLSGGAAFGAVVAISFSSLDVAWGPFAGVQVLALLGAFFNIGVVYLLARKKGSISSSALLLAGVTLGLISGSGILFVRYLTRPDLLVNMDRWLMGGLSVLGYRKLVSILPLLVPGVALLLWHGRDYNQLVLGEEMAAGRGVNVASLRRISFFGGSLITAAVVAVAGPIGFVGLLVPHIIRRLIGNDHRLLLPCAFLGGGGFLVICDTFARTIVAPTELPVGIVTALLGGPFFLYLLVRLR
jgi:iron complex transport system permease protein